jgi:hypothetical protein
MNYVTLAKKKFTALFRRNPSDREPIYSYKNNFCKSQFFNLFDSVVDKFYSLCNLHVYEKSSGLCVRFKSI